VQAAVEANNLFHPLTYEGVVDIDKESDPMKRYAAMTAALLFVALCVRLCAVLGCAGACHGVV
jgi:hypothetical protein